jgi:hypothetical protein
LVIEPAEPGAVAVTVKLAVLDEVRPADSVTEQVRVAPAELRLVQVTPDTPEPAVAAVAVTPAGSFSATVAEVPEVVEPLLPRVRV